MSFITQRLVFKGIITHGGDRPNIIPGKTKLSYYVRSASDSGLNEALDRVEKCARAAGLASGCKVRYPS